MDATTSLLMCRQYCLFEKPHCLFKDYLFIRLKGTFDFLLILSDISKHQDINSKCPHCHGYMESVEGQKKFEKLTGGSIKQA